MNRISLIEGGEKLNYEGDLGTSTVPLIETIFVINSMISDAKQGDKWLSCDLKDFSW